MPNWRGIEKRTALPPASRSRGAHSFQKKAKAQSMRIRPHLMSVKHGLSSQNWLRG
ncbi:MAG: hypothetical protein ACK6DY_14520 [Acidobacteriota bacterium]